MVIDYESSVNKHSKEEYGAVLIEFVPLKAIIVEKCAQSCWFHKLLFRKSQHMAQRLLLALILQYYLNLQKLFSAHNMV